MALTALYYRKSVNYVTRIYHHLPLVMAFLRCDLLLLFRRYEFISIKG